MRIMRMKKDSMRRCFRVYSFAAARIRKDGFSLVEVCLAILVIGFGLMVVFSLFPSGLRSGEAGTADTRNGLFAESVMAGLRANADSIDNLADWTTDFQTNIVKDVLTVGGVPRDITVGQIDIIRFPDGSDYLRYRLTVDASKKSALLEVEDGRYPANVLNAPSLFYTEFWYTGM